MDPGMFWGGLVLAGVGLLARRFGWRVTAEWLRVTGTPEDGPGWRFMLGLHHVGVWVFIVAGALFVFLSFFLSGG